MLKSNLYLGKNNNIKKETIKEIKTFGIYAHIKYMETVISNIKKSNTLSCINEPDIVINNNVSFVIVNARYICPVLKNKTHRLYSIGIRDNDIFLSKMVVGPVIKNGNINIVGSNPVSIEEIDINTFDPENYYYDFIGDYAI